MSDKEPFLIDPQLVKQLIDQTIEKNILTAIEQLIQDPNWLAKIEQLVNQAVVQRTVSSLNQLDVREVIRQRIDENFEQFQQKTPGIQIQAKNCELTVMDEHVVVENNLTSRDLSVVGTATVKDLIVKGAINTDNRSWDGLASRISEKTFETLNEVWRASLVAELTEHIKKNGIAFDNVTVDGQRLITGDSLNSSIVNSNLQTLGQLKQLNVRGESKFGETMSVLNKRVGINTQEPEMALSVWDEEISILVGKYKNNTAFVGTGRAHSLAIGTNRETALEIDLTGLTTVKKLRVGANQIGHGNTLPNWAGIKGDIIFNTNASVDNNIFAWVCLGGHKWKELRSL